MKNINDIPIKLKLKYAFRKAIFIISLALILLISLPFYLIMAVSKFILILISFGVRLVDKDLYLKYLNTLLKF
jgi:hypothetical protein